MKLAKERVALKTTLQILWGVYIAVNIFLVGIWFFTGTGYFWPGWVMGGWGFALIVVTVIFASILSGPSSQSKVEAEFDRLKSSAPPADEPYIDKRN
jgi:hypothetical protein